MIAQVSNSIFKESTKPSINENIQRSMMISREVARDLIDQKRFVKESKYAFFDKFFRGITASNVLIDTLRKEAGEEILHFLSHHLSLNNQKHILFTSTDRKLRDQVDYNDIQSIINLQQVNTHKDINHWFRSINKLLPNHGFYAGCVETYDNRMQKMEYRFGKALAKIIGVADFFYNRVLPRLEFTRKFYNKLNKNQYKSLSLAETLGRLVYCGFEIIDYKVINGLIYFIVKKHGEPKNSSNISEGLIFPMSRIGRQGKIIKVYKLRTMHPYSEFLQEFIVKRNGYNHAGKPANDFRLTGWGKLFRKLWLDEIPQLINVLKGELAIVGPRPLSLVRFNQFPEDLRNERIKYKPGCVPPYVALCMPDAIGNMIAERIYFREIHDNPYFTNMKYFLMAVYNIAFNKIRST